MTSKATDLIACDGLDAANPLAFLATLGAFRVLQENSADAAVRLHWELRHGAWRPVFTMPTKMTPNDFVVGLDTLLRAHAGHAALRLDDNLKIPRERYREHCREALDAWFSGDRRSADFAAAFGSEVFADEHGNMQDTAFRTMSGAGHQHFLKFMRNVIVETGANHLRKTLFEPWRYDDPMENLTLRWDPADDQRYALRWRNPRGDPVRKQTGSMLGANRLAIEALPLLPVIPTASRPITTGFTGRRSYDTFWTWPIWKAPLPLGVCHSVLAIDFNQSRAELNARGIVAVFRSQRISIGKYRNFTPSLAV